MISRDEMYQDIKEHGKRSYEWYKDYSYSELNNEVLRSMFYFCRGYFEQSELTYKEVSDMIDKALNELREEFE